MCYKNKDRVDVSTGRHSLWCFVFALLFLPVGSLRAQSELLELQADSLYRQFVAMRIDTGSTKGDIYNKSLECCLAYKKLMQSSPEVMPQFDKSRKAINSLLPFVKAGAGYNSEAGNDSLGLIFAKEYVDFVMMREMSDSLLRKDSYYPNVVLYLASHKYNAGMFDEAVVYLREYLDITDPSRHSDILGFLKQAEELLARENMHKGIRHIDVNADVPDFDVFAKGYIERGMEKWQQKDPYETVSEYKARVNETTAVQKQKELQEVLMNEYIRRFSRKMAVTDMQIKPYDAENQSFLIISPYGNIVLMVPRGNDEARNFSENWDKVKISNQQFVIADKKLALAGLTFTTPEGREYKYSNQQALTWNDTKVDANFIAVNVDKLENSDGSEQKTTIGEMEVIVGQSDVDINIPWHKGENNHTFAVIIANEDYTVVPKVPMAGNDGKVFAKYCVQTLGIPQENIRQYPDATYGEMIRAITDITNISHAYNGDIKVIFYYSGHGIPNESTKDAFLLPIDADGTHTEACYPLKKLYRELSGLNAESVVVLLDACFSGSTGDGGSLMANARGVALKARQESPEGNMVVFSAATGDETAYPFTERHHGLFTYFLLKKLQSSKGNANLGEISEYVIENVKRRSAIVNHKIQTPTISFSQDMQTKWRKIRLR